MVKATDGDTAALLSAKLGLLPLTARLLCARGQDTVEKAESFLKSKNVKMIVSACGTVSSYINKLKNPELLHSG